MGPRVEEGGGRQRGLADDLDPVLDAAVGQVDAVEIFVEELVEGIDLVADVGVGGGCSSQESGQGLQAEMAGSHGTSLPLGRDSSAGEVQIDSMPRHCWGGAET